MHAMVSKAIEAKMLAPVFAFEAIMEHYNGSAPMFTLWTARSRWAYVEFDHTCSLRDLKVLKRIVHESCLENTS